MTTMMVYFSLLSLVLMLSVTSALPTLRAAADDAATLSLATLTSSHRSRRHAHDLARRQCYRQVSHVLQRYL